MLETEYNSTTQLTGADMSETGTAADSENSSIKSDEERLRLLGYDSVLGRQFGFWSTMGLNICHQSITYEFLLSSSIHLGRYRTEFLWGYPLQAIFVLILLSVFSELASAFPVSGAMATWSWRSARKGVRKERQWGWLVSGFVLAAHLAKTIAYLYNATVSLTKWYQSLASPPTGAAYRPLPPWWLVVASTGLLTLTAVIMLSRIGRTSAFWIIVGGLYVTYVLIFLATMCRAFVISPPVSLTNHARDLGPKALPSTAIEIFTSLPLKILTIEAPAHMAEETKKPAKTVPRVMFASTLFHLAMVYVLVSVYILTPMDNPNTWVRMVQGPWHFISAALQMSKAARNAYFIGSFMCDWLQILASVLVTSRFVFALARDHGMPFSNWLVKTSKDGEPWVADIAVLVALYASMTGWFIPGRVYNGIVVTYAYYILAVPYLICLVLYGTSKLNLRDGERTQFTIGTLSKPFAWISAVWLFLGIVQGSFPLQLWVLSRSAGLHGLSYLPFMIGGMVIVMLISWLVYGRRHYIGPIRALTKWSAGVEINPMDFTTSQGRSATIRAYILSQTGSRGGDHPSTGDTGESTSSGTTSFIKRLFGRSSKGSASGGEALPQSTTGRHGHNTLSNEQSQYQTAPPGRRFTTTTAHQDAAASAIPESGLFPISESRTEHALADDSQIMSTGDTESRPFWRLPYVLRAAQTRQQQQQQQRQRSQEHLINEPGYPMRPIRPGSQVGRSSTTDPAPAPGWQQWSHSQEESQLEPPDTSYASRGQSELLEPVPAAEEAEARIDFTMGDARFTAPTPPFRVGPPAPKRWR